MNLSPLLKIAMRAVNEGERLALKQFDYSTIPSVSFKKNHETVTATDIQVNQTVIRILKKYTPDIPVISEEGGTLDLSKVESVKEAWVLDPIDGTSNFSMRLPLWGISLGLVRNGTVVLGVIALPALHQRYHAIKGKGAWFGKKRLSVSPVKKLSHATGLLCYGYTKSQRQSGLNAIHDFSVRSQTVRRLGAAVIEATWIASGRADYSVLYGAKPWDLAAGTILIREAGGLVLRPDGKEWMIEDEDVIFTTPMLAKEILHVIKKK